MAWVLPIVGTALSMNGEHSASVAQQAALNSQATDAYALGTRQAQAARREGDAVMGDARAAMAASGADTNDSGMQTILGKINATSEQNALSRMYDAASNARNLRMGASNIAGGARMAEVATAINGLGAAYQGYKRANTGGGYKSPYASAGSSRAPLNDYTIPPLDYSGTTFGGVLQ